MKQVTYYHEMIYKGLNNLTTLKNNLNPFVNDFRKGFEINEIDPALMTKIAKPLAELEKEITQLNKLIRDVCEDCKDIYEGMV
ncbi:MAG: hypothetical protein GX452_10460 [Ignavibacteriales bacterium]|jgi:hypothetical protein|nr:hypothetical protein [Ignavibacteriaceae bacterium]NLH61815.1 hypothetical protein [Ignavibacteriales bacterium]HOJ18195.1 hypothetical protein [Ignavibacteriaceae bacterium]HPO55747.1 hypothetical protein [Ignavibacteriaceae bacterium]